MSEKLITIKEIAVMAQVSESSARYWPQRYHNFPDPVNLDNPNRKNIRQLFRLSDVVKFLETRLKTPTSTLDLALARQFITRGF